MRFASMMMGMGAAGCVNERIPVGATLKDGQVLVGAISTPVLELEGALGKIRISLDDVGQLVPVEGSTLGDSHGNVDVWLRNGSELKGKWADPELQMAIEVGGKPVSVTVPTQDLQALQLRGAEEWPTDAVYRVRTSHGDDFLVDPRSTRIHLESALGSFEPSLAECRSVGPVGPPDGEWRVELHTGSVLVGKVTESTLKFVLPMGPDQVEVPLTALVSLTQGGWGPGPAELAPPVAASPASAEAPAPPEDGRPGRRGRRPGSEATPEQAARVKGALSSSDGWFESGRMEDAKR